MEICVVGSGVIGTIYGHLFTEAGHDVTHLVRPGHGARLRDGLELHILDARSGTEVEVGDTYRPPVIEHLDGAIRFDLIVAGVKHYQLPELLPTLASGAGTAEILFFNNLWTSFAPVDAKLRGRYLWGFPVAGGGFEEDRLEGALLGEVKLGGPGGVSPERLHRVDRLFAGCRLGVDLRHDMLAWLWTHFAVEAGVIATAIKAGGVAEFLDDVDRLAEAVLAVRDALAVVEARGVDVRSQQDAQMFFAPERVVAEGIRDLYKRDRAARRIMERHTGGNELKRIYFNVVSTGRELGVDMPALGALESYVRALGMAAV